MKLTDTHIHLYADEFTGEIDKLIVEAGNQGVERFLLPNIDVNSIDIVFNLSQRFPERCFAMMGLHPCYVNESYEEQLNTIRKHIAKRKNEIVAIGEIGLDFYWDLTFKQQQEAAFRQQVIWAHELSLPISIHSRNSTGELIDILHDLNLPELKGVFHCFSGDINQADNIMNMGFFFGIGGVVTFKNSGLEKIVADIPIEFIVLETDGPYLAPTPFRGKLNKPQYLRIIAEKVAEIKNITTEEVAAITSENARKLFKLPVSN